MKITMNKALEMKAPLSKIVKMQITLPIKVSYFFLKVIKRLDEEYEIFDKEKDRLLSIYGEKDKEGNLIKNNQGFVIQKDKISNFEKEINDLLNIEIDLNINPLEIDNLNLPISIEDLMMIDVLFKEKEGA